ncbi:MAG: nuclear transport factor 2 family protein [Pseudonocardiales bacterium]|nr:nuclear transport factor 2 family protein [Pseudonocardiales bacterium]
MSLIRGPYDANEEIGRRFLALVSEHDIDGLIAMISPTWTMHGGPPELPAGEAGIRQLFATFGRIKQQWTVADVIATVDKVAVRATNTVDQDSFLGIPSHGRQQVFTAMFIHHITGGLISQTWRNADDLGRLLQLGARIEPGRPYSSKEAAPTAKTV